MKPRIGLIGAGGYASAHLAALLLRQEQGRCVLAAVADPSPEKLAEVTAASPETAVFEDYREMLDQSPLDGVIIATPIPLHEEMAAYAIHHGLAVLLEKPAVPLPSQLNRLLASNPRVAVAYQRVSSGPFRLLRKLLAEGAIGELHKISVVGISPRDTNYYCRASWAGRLHWQGRPVFDGPATNALSHWVNNIAFLAGGANPPPLPEYVQAELYRARPIPAYDTVCMQGRFQSGIDFYAAFTHAAATRVPTSLTAHGSHGSITLGQEGTVLQSKEVAIPKYEEDSGYDRMLDSFLSYAAGQDVRPDVMLSDVVSVTLTTTLMMQSASVIRDVPQEAYEVCHLPENREVYAIRSIEELMLSSFQKGVLFSELGVDWAVPTQTVAAESLDETRLPI